MISRLARLTWAVKVVLASRGLFKNWLPAWLIYVFSRLTGREIRVHVVCRDSSETSISSKAFGRIIRGYYYGIFTGISCVEGKVFSGNLSIPIREFEITSGSPAYIMRLVELGWRFNESCACWEKGGVKFKYMYATVLQVFEGGEYALADVSGKTVVDIGATCGDSTIYFLVRGAERVVAVEPCPDYYRELLENLELNRLSGRVKPVNAAVSSRGGRMKIECPSGETMVDTIRLRDLVREFNIRGGVLKMDCEGCEYDVIANEYEYVRLFDEVYFEYHTFITGVPVEEIIKRLSRDFKCQVVSNTEFYLRYTFSPQQLGLVKCVKR